MHLYYHIPDTLHILLLNSDHESISFILYSFLLVFQFKGKLHFSSSSLCHFGIKIFLFFVKSETFLEAKHMQETFWANSSQFEEEAAVPTTTTTTTIECNYLN